MNDKQEIIVQDVDDKAWIYIQLFLPARWYDSQAHERHLGQCLAASGARDARHGANISQAPPPSPQNAGSDQNNISAASDSCRSLGDTANSQVELKRLGALIGWEPAWRSPGTNHTLGRKREEAGRGKQQLEQRWLVRCLGKGRGFSDGTGQGQERGFWRAWKLAVGAEYPLPSPTTQAIGSMLLPFVLTGWNIASWSASRSTRATCNNSIAPKIALFLVRAQKEGSMMTFFFFFFFFAVDLAGSAGVRTHIQQID